MSSIRVNAYAPSANAALGLRSTVLSDLLLESLENGISTTHRNTLHLLLLLRINNLPMINNHRITTSSLPLSPSILGRELDAVVAQEQDIVVVDAVGLGPARHDIWVVASDDSDDVDARLLQLWQLLNILWEVAPRAGWGEGPWDGEEDDLLVGPLCEDVSLKLMRMWGGQLAG